MSPFTAMRSRAWIIDSASTIAAPRSPNERIQSPISRPAELRVVRKPALNDCAVRLTRYPSQLSRSRWASRLVDSGHAMIILVASRGPSVAPGT
jgi:uncharacterized protein (DUF3084 family)